MTEEDKKVIFNRISEEIVSISYKKVEKQIDFLSLGILSNIMNLSIFKKRREVAVEIENINKKMEEIADSFSDTRNPSIYKIPLTSKIRIPFSTYTYSKTFSDKYTGLNSKYTGVNIINKDFLFKEYETSIFLPIKDTFDISPYYVEDAIHDPFFYNTIFKDENSISLKNIKMSCLEIELIEGENKDNQENINSLFKKRDLILGEFIDKQIPLLLELKSFIFNRINDVYDIATYFKDFIMNYTSFNDPLRRLISGSMTMPNKFNDFFMRK